MLNRCPKCDYKISLDEWLEDGYCPSCNERLCLCDECGSLIPIGEFYTDVDLCSDCFYEHYDACANCGEIYAIGDLQDDFCEVCFF